MELKQISGKLVSANKVVLNDFGLQTYPNPFTDQIKISFGLKQPAQLNLAIYDMNGRFIESISHEKFNAGNYELQWKTNGKSLLSGNYILSIMAETEKGSFKQSKTIQLLK